MRRNAIFAATGAVLMLAIGASARLGESNPPLGAASAAAIPGTGAGEGVERGSVAASHAQTDKREPCDRGPWAPRASGSLHHLIGRVAGR